ncbi:MAG: FAD/NAD(P)-binding protein, partial [Ferruginibacter sp.]
MLTKNNKTIAIVGGGPAALFMYKRLIESGNTNLTITIFERKNKLGSGMPYSPEGASSEHVTNVSGNEIPNIVNSVPDWLQSTHNEIQRKFNITPENFNDLKVMPRLLFGEYLSNQFELLKSESDKRGIITDIHLDTLIIDIKDDPSTKKAATFTSTGSSALFDHVIICTGHYWPKVNEGATQGWFDSPYPPAKLSGILNHPVAIKGAALTAIDAIRTLARQNGFFTETANNMLEYTLHEHCREFKLVLHSIDGLLPSIRFHLNDPHLSPGNTEWTEEEIYQVMEANDGFIPLDYIFERNFKAPLLKGDPVFYQEIKDMLLDEFVEHMMGLRNNANAFELFKEEYMEAERSIKTHKSVYWKERLSILSYALNYPAKHLSAEDMIRYKKILMPLISIVIAFVPQSSAKELLALYEAKVLTLLSVDKATKVEPAAEGGAYYLYNDENGSGAKVWYKTFIDGTGQKPINYDNFLFVGLK